MNIQRIKALFAYDWAVEKRRMTLVTVTIMLLYLLVCWYTYTINRNTLWEGSPEVLAHSYNAVCKVFFAIVGFCSVFIITPILHHKFTQPQMSTSYLTLPGTTAEKFWVMLCEYVMGFVAVFLLYVICYYATMTLGWLCSNVSSAYDGAASESLWWSYRLIPFDWNDLPEASEFIRKIIHSAQDYGSAIQAAALRLICSLVLVIPFGILLDLGIYMVLNMFFRTYGQLKSIGCRLVLQMIFNLLASFVVMAVVAYMANIEEQYGEEKLEEAFVLGLNILTVLIWLIPVLTAGIYYFLYRLMAKKQAK